MPNAEGTVLLVEDDAQTRAFVAQALEDEGLRVQAVGRGDAATRALKDGSYAAIVLDVWLPDASGIELCRTWRASGLRSPILMLTAQTGVSSRVAGLDAGADDYLGKPFALAELKARLRALLRRGSEARPARRFERGALRVDFDRRQAWSERREIPLTRREIDVLERLVWAGGRVVSRDDLLEELWGEASAEAAASLEVIVARLRRKLEGPDKGSLIRTVRGHGYALARPGEDEP